MAKETKNRNVLVNFEGSFSVSEAPLRSLYAQSQAAARGLRQ